jgi:hypothetical protein
MEEGEEGRREGGDLLAICPHLTLMFGGGGEIFMFANNLY